MVKSTVQEIVNYWYNNSFEWARYAFLSLHANGNFNEVAKNCVDMVRKNEGFPAEWPELPTLVSPTIKGGTMCLKSISEISNIGAISDDSKLMFTQKNNEIAREMVIYGQNGSGKSTYVNLLKSFLNSENSRPVLTNVFLPQGSQKKSAKVTYLINNKEYSSQWNDEKLKYNIPRVNIFDEFSVSEYADTDSEFEFQPSLLKIFSQISQIADQIREVLSVEKDDIVTNRPSIPVDLDDTSVVSSIKEANSENSIDDLKKIADSMQWLESDTEQLQAYNQAVNTKNVVQEIQNKQNQLKTVKTFVSKIDQILDTFSTQNLDQIKMDIDNLVASKRSVEQLANKDFSNQKLKDVGGQSWRLMWEAARKYAEKAYEGGTFPVSSRFNRCLLCQQPLSDEAQSRLISFEEFVSSELESKVDESTQKLLFDSKELKQLRFDDLVTLFEQVKPFLNYTGPTVNLDVFEPYSNIQHSIENLECWKKFDVTELTSVEQAIRQAGNTIFLNIKSLKETRENMNAVQIKLRNLEAKKWVVEHPEYIQSIISELSINSTIRTATNTKVFSDLQHSLSDILLTKRYIQTFNDYLHELGAENLSVAIKTRGSKGRTKFRVVLNDTSQSAKINQILSDGQQAIVALAAFLAELEISDWNYPAIFDDPVTSLDQEFELKVAYVLTELSRKRQVIIFTHRLSLAYELQMKAKDMTGFEITGMRQEPVGYCSTESLPYQAQRMDKAVRKYLQELKTAKKRMSENKPEEHDAIVEGLVKKIRTLVENSVETTLLNGVVRRFNREVQTKRLRYIAVISDDDITLFKKWMTTYSFQDHSQPSEAPVNLPSDEVINDDLSEMLDWYDDFTKRQKSVD
ncbi:AAA family ATPase [Lactiplantibacillus plantarum]|uniref:AAA family ATPase n=1 Tax=Lactiplantibacillus plantarum TaxID=1590 RepID=UPI0006A6058F|nr:AAA family ATPase [Lactiplantibacillus plantarum]ASD33180.1 hypothetical protein CEF05_11315 [Lactiplantibacillus plantarum]AXI11961.1 hypothetical protein C6I22_03870 [Lactiplantibacillus plantarum]KOE72657.1 hypothetical protein AB662_06390 [Lactiplantibacillus plantarum]MBW4798905.1 AAA family ATPase [Lactiplantibacillus plantarum]MBW4806904.1 AAA family ATPase [Lactiplantibacillus plantarum]